MKMVTILSNKLFYRRLFLVALPLAWILLIAGQSEPFVKRIFELSFFLAILSRTYGTEIINLFKRKEFQVFAVLLMYVIIQSFWMDSYAVTKVLETIVWLGLFLYAHMCFWHIQNTDLPIGVFKKYVCIIGVAHAAWVLLLLVFKIETMPYSGQNFLDNPNYAGAIIGSWLIFSLLLKRPKDQHPWQQKKSKIFYSISYILMAIALVSTGSRGSIASTLVICFFANALSKQGMKATLAMLVVVSFVMLVAVNWEYPMISEWINRGSSYRFVLWEQVINSLSENSRWYFGWGIGHITDLWLPYGQQAIHPHSIYFGSLYYGGVVGGVLYISLLALVSYRFIRLLSEDNQTNTSFLVAMSGIWFFGLVLGIVDYGAWFQEFHVDWLWLWVPFSWLGYVLLLNSNIKVPHENTA